jgi:hypothetical protein
MPPPYLHKPSAVLLLVGGILTMLSYAVLLPQVQPGRPVSSLWFGIDGRVRNMYYISMVVAAAGFLLVGSWLVFGARDPSSNTTRTRTRLPLSVFFGGSIMWSVALLWWGRSHHSTTTCTHRASVLAVLAALVATTVGAGGLTWELWTSRTAPAWATVGAALVLLHVGVLDNVGWYLAYWRAVV